MLLCCAAAGVSPLCLARFTYFLTQKSTPLSRSKSKYSRHCFVLVLVALAGSVVRPTSNYCILTPVAVTVEVDWTTERTTTTANGRSKSESTGAFYLDTPTYVRSTSDTGFLEGDSRVSVSCLLDNSKWCSAGFLI